MSLEITPDWCFIKISSIPIFYNYKEDLISLTLPCPIKNIKQFIKVYKLDVTYEELVSSIKKINKNANFEMKKNKNENDKNLLAPITDVEKLQEFLKLSESQSISNVFEQISKYKYGILLNGSYYQDPENTLFKYTYYYRKIKLYEGPFEMFKKVARKNCMKEILKKLCPTIFEEMYKNYIKRHNIKYNVFNFEKNYEDKNNETNKNLNKQEYDEEIVNSKNKIIETSLNENNDKVNLKEKNIIVNLDNKVKTKKTSNGFYTIKVNKNEIKNNIKLKKDKNDDKNNNRNSIININNINMISENKKFLGLKRINNNESNAQSKITVITIDDSSSSDSDSSFDSICISSSINK